MAVTTLKHETAERKIYTNIRFPLILANMRLKKRYPSSGSRHVPSGDLERAVLNGETACIASWNGLFRTLEKHV